MPQTETDVDLENGEFGKIASGRLGHGNLGSFGPNSPGEAVLADSYANPEYAVVPVEGSSCMDDRGEGLRLQLPGNRAHSEIAGEYCDKQILPKPLSLKTAQKTRELVDKAQTPQYHGDKTSHKKGCAAVLFTRDALSYNAENPEQAAHLALERLRMAGIDSIGLNELVEMAKIGGERVADGTLWDVDSEQLINIAIKNGADYTEFEGAHHTAGPREDMSPHAFDNGKFRQANKTEDGYPLGALSLTYGLYVEQLRNEGYGEPEIARKAAGVVLYSVAMLKLACKQEAVDVIVGYGMIN